MLIPIKMDGGKDMPPPQRPLTPKNFSGLLRLRLFRRQFQPFVLLTIRSPRRMQSLNGTTLGIPNDRSIMPGCSWFSVFPGRFLNWDEVTLGRLVLDLRDPVQHFCPHTIPIGPNEISIIPFEEITPMLNRRGESRFQTVFAKLISMVYPNNSSVEFVA